MRRLNLDINQLKELYLVKGMRMDKIGQVLGHSPITVCKYLKIAGIPIDRSRKVKLPISDEEIIKMYTQDMLSMEEIAKKVGRSVTAINNRLKEHNVQIRHFVTERQREKLRIFNTGKVSPRRNLEVRIKSKQIVEMYTNQLKSSSEIAREFNCEKLLIERVLKQNGVMLNQSERMKRLYASGKLVNHMKGKFGEKSPFWLGGLSFEPYTPEFNKEFKNLVRLRDNFCCLNCGISEQSQMVLLGRKLTVHHVDYNKKNTCLVNCCTLCLKCNSMANKNRSEWTSFYQEKMSKRYGYQYPLVNQEAKIGVIKNGI